MFFRVLLAALLCASLPSRADPLIDGALLGLDEGQLKSAVTGVSRLHKAVQGPRGLKGLWKGPDTQLADLRLDSTFFVRSGRIARIEQQAVSVDPRCAEPDFFDGVVSEMTSRYGVPLVADDPASGSRSHQSFAWGRADVDVLMHIWRSPTQCSVLVVQTPHLEKDAAEL